MILIDLDGPGGNALALIASFRDIMKRLALKSQEEIEDIVIEMRKGDYNNLIRIFNEHCGEYVTFFNATELAYKQGSSVSHIGRRNWPEFNKAGE